MIQDEILMYRAKENLSQREMAQRCKVTVQTLNRVEKGLQKPSRLTETKIRLVIGGEK